VTAMSEAKSQGLRTSPPRTAEVAILIAESYTAVRESPRV
jgi:hypothetical protein